MTKTNHRCSTSGARTAPARLDERRCEWRRADRAAAQVLIEHVDDVLDRLRRVAEKEDVDPGEPPGDQLARSGRRAPSAPTRSGPTRASPARSSRRDANRDTPWAGLRQRAGGARRTGRADLRPGAPCPGPQADENGDDHDGKEVDGLPVDDAALELPTEVEPDRAERQRGTGPPDRSSRPCPPVRHRPRTSSASAAADRLSFGMNPQTRASSSAGPRSDASRLDVSTTIGR